MNNRILSLDVLRGVAVLLVLFRHSDGLWGTKFELLARGGWIGVDLFFVLSGFLVSGLLFREFDKGGTIRPINFLVRRGWKIYPAFWALMLVTVCLFAWAGKVPDIGSKLLTEMTFTQSYSENRLWDHTWSLAIEEHFYLILPFLLIGLQRDGFKSLPKVVAMVMAGLLVAKCINGFRPFTNQTHLFATHLRLDAMFFGVLLCYWHRTWPEFNTYCGNNSTSLVLLGVLVLIPAFMYSVESNVYLHTVGLTVNILAAGAILMGMVCGGVKATIPTRFVGWIGMYSYSIYLWHFLVICGLIPMLGIQDPILFSLAGIVGSVIVGIGASQIIEMPALKLRDSLAVKPALA